MGSSSSRPTNHTESNTVPSVSSFPDDLTVERILSSVGRKVACSFKSLPVDAPTDSYLSAFVNIASKNIPGSILSPEDMSKTTVTTDMIDRFRSSGKRIQSDVARLNRILSPKDVFRLTGMEAIYVSNQGKLLAYSDEHDTFFLVETVGNGDIPLHAMFSAPYTSRRDCMGVMFRGFARGYAREMLKSPDDYGIRELSAELSKYIFSLDQDAIHVQFRLPVPFYDHMDSELKVVFGNKGDGDNGEYCLAACNDGTVKWLLQSMCGNGNHVWTVHLFDPPSEGELHLSQRLRRRGLIFQSEAVINNHIRGNFKGQEFYNPSHSNMESSSSWPAWPTNHTQLNTAPSVSSLPDDMTLDKVASCLSSLPDECADTTESFFSACLNIASADNIQASSIISLLKHAIDKVISDRLKSASIRIESDFERLGRILSSTEDFFRLLRMEAVYTSNQGKLLAYSDENENLFLVEIVGNGDIPLHAMFSAPYTCNRDTMGVLLRVANRGMLKPPDNDFTRGELSAELSKYIFPFDEDVIHIQFKLPVPYFIPGYSMLKVVFGNKEGGDDGEYCLTACNDGTLKWLPQSQCENGNHVWTVYLFDPPFEPEGEMHLCKRVRRRGAIVDNNYLNVTNNFGGNRNGSGLQTVGNINFDLHLSQISNGGSN